MKQRIHIVGKYFVFFHIHPLYIRELYIYVPTYFYELFT